MLWNPSYLQNPFIDSTNVIEHLLTYLHNSLMWIKQWIIWDSSSGSGRTFARMGLKCRDTSTRKTFEGRDDVDWNCGTIFLQAQKEKERKKEKQIFVSLWVKKEVGNKYLFSVGGDLKENEITRGIPMEDTHKWWLFAGPQAPRGDVTSGATGWQGSQLPCCPHNAAPGECPVRGHVWQNHLENPFGKLSSITPSFSKSIWKPSGSFPSSRVASL